MSDYLEKEIETLIGCIEDEGIKKEVEVARKNDPMVNLKENILLFFTKRINHIGKREKLLDKIQAKIEEKVDTEEFEIDELLNLFRIISIQVGNATSDFTGLFKAAPGAPSPLANQVSDGNSNEDDFEEFGKRVPPETLEKIEEMYRIVSNTGKKEE